MSNSTPCYLNAMFSEPNQAWLILYGNPNCPQGLTSVAVQGSRIYEDLDDLRWNLRILGLRLVWKARQHYRIEKIQKGERR